MSHQHFRPLLGMPSADPAPSYKRCAWLDIRPPNPEPRMNTVDVKLVSGIDCPHACCRNPTPPRAAWLPLPPF